MKVYYGHRGNSYYIMCFSNGKSYVAMFDRFGSFVGLGGSVSSCVNWVEVGCISFLSVGSGECELLYNGKKALLGKSLFDAISPIRKGTKYLNTMFNISHEDEFGKFNQVIFLFSKGVLSNSFINDLYPNREWVSL